MIQRSIILNQLLKKTFGFAINIDTLSYIKFKHKAIIVAMKNVYDYGYKRNKV